MEWRWGLEPLGVRAATTNNLAYALDFENPPRSDAPMAFDVPGNLGQTVACGLQSVMTRSMDAHAEEVRALQAKARAAGRSEEHTSELQSLMRISYAVYCLKKKNKSH